MVEVRYIRWKAIVMIGVGALIAIAGILTGIGVQNWILCSGLFFAGCLIMHIANLRLQERDVLLRLTPTQLWTKEFGWQPWENLIVSLEEYRSGYTLEIRRPFDLTPRFFEYVSTLNISVEELKRWVESYSISKI